MFDDPLRKVRLRFQEAVTADGFEMAAARLRVSSQHVRNIIKGHVEDIGVRLAVAIEEAYAIPVAEWVVRPASRKP